MQAVASSAEIPGLRCVGDDANAELMHFVQEDGTRLGSVRVTLGNDGKFAIIFEGQVDDTWAALPPIVGDAAIDTSYMLLSSPELVTTSLLAPEQPRVES